MCIRISDNIANTYMKMTFPEHYSSTFQHGNMSGVSKAHTHTYSTSKSTFSYSEGLKMCESINISRLIFFFTTTVLPYVHYVCEKVKYYLEIV